MARPERIGQSLESLEALIHYLEEGEKPASYGGVRQSVPEAAWISAPLNDRAFRSRGCRHVPSLSNRPTIARLSVGESP